MYGVFFLPMIKPWGQDDAKFKSFLQDGRNMVAYVTFELISRGVGVAVPPSRVRPDGCSFEKMEEFSDEGDLRVYYEERDSWPRVEVKGRSVEFTGLDDFPFNTVLVDTVRNIDKKGAPAAYITVSQQTGAMIIISRRSKHTWSKTSRFDSKRQIDETFYEAPVNECKTFDEFVRFLKID